MEVSDFCVELVEGGAKRTREAVVSGEQGGPARPQDAQIELGVEEGHFQPVTGGGVAVRLRDPMDQPLSRKRRRS